MRKLGIGSESVQKKRAPYWLVVLRISLVWLLFVLVLLSFSFAMFGCASPKPMGVLIEERVFKPDDLKCWSDSKTFTCMMPLGASLDSFLFVGKLRYSVDAAIIKECIDRGLATEESFK